MSNFPIRLKGSEATNDSSHDDGRTQDIDKAREEAYAEKPHRDANVGLFNVAEELINLQENGLGADFPSDEIVYLKNSIQSFNNQINNRELDSIDTRLSKKVRQRALDDIEALKAEIEVFESRIDFDHSLDRRLRRNGDIDTAFEEVAVEIKDNIAKANEASREAGEEYEKTQASIKANQGTLKDLKAK